MTLGAALVTATERLDCEYDTILLDLDGVVYRGADALPGAAPALNQALDNGAVVAYLTNNASRRAETVAAHLRELSMPVPEDSLVITSAQAVAAVMARQLPQGAVVLVVGGDGLRAAIAAKGFIAVESADEQPVAVVQGYDPSISWSQLAEAAYAVQQGAIWYASNEDLTIPTERGLAPGNGSLVNVVRAATGTDPIVAGKPARPLFEETLRRVNPSRPLMVGDRLDTDVDGAINAGIDSLAVLTGVGTLTQWCAAPLGHRPSYVAADLSALSQNQPAVHVDDGTATCGQSVVAVQAQKIVLRTGDPTEVSTLRATVGLAWSFQDSYGIQLAPGGRLAL